MKKQELKKYIPLEKSWIIRMGILDLIHGRSQTIDYLRSQDNLGDDLLTLKKVVEGWGSDKPLDVGESGTLYRFLLFTNWSLNLNKRFTISGTLKDRQVTQNPSIIGLSQKDLLHLDGETSQWASAKALLGDQDRLLDPPHLLAMTYEAVEHWNTQYSSNQNWEPKLDRTIYAQAEAFTRLIRTGRVVFKPKHAEDYCFARALGLITKEEGEKRWPALRNHESDRINSMEEELDRAGRGIAIKSKDHRVIQAMAIWGVINKKDVQFEHPKSVDKTWPLFWQFLELASN